MNKAIYILAAIVLVVVLGWTNAYDYIPDGAHGLWRINRLTNKASYANTYSDKWETIDESASFDISTAKPDTGGFDLSTAKPVKPNPFDQFDRKQSASEFLDSTNKSKP